MVRAELRSAIVGMILGDGSIKQQKGCTSVSLSIVHSSKQKEYLEWKRNILQALFSEWKIPIVEFNNNNYPGVRVITRTHPKLKQVYRLFYKPKKTISRKVLNYLTPIGIAIWYMDDGSLSLKKRNGAIHGREIHLNTYCTLEEASIIQEYFKERWCISWTIVSNKGLYRLRMGANEAKTLFKLIECYIIPCMKYKLDFKYNNK